MFEDAHFGMYKKSIWQNWKLFASWSLTMLKLFSRCNEFWMEMEGKRSESNLRSTWGSFHETILFIVSFRWHICLRKKSKFRKSKHLMDCVKNCRHCKKISMRKLNFPFWNSCLFSIFHSQNSTQFTFTSIDWRGFQESPELARMKWDGISHQSKFWQALWEGKCGEMKSIFIFP